MNYCSIGSARRSRARGKKKRVVWPRRCPPPPPPIVPTDLQGCVWPHLHTFCTAHLSTSRYLSECVGIFLRGNELLKIWAYGKEIVWLYKSVSAPRDSAKYNKEGNLYYSPPVYNFFQMTMNLLSILTITSEYWSRCTRALDVNDLITLMEARRRLSEHVYIRFLCNIYCRSLAACNINFLTQYIWF